MHSSMGTAVPWYSPSSGRAQSRHPGINIKLKISQWEGRTQQPGPSRHALLSRTLSDGSEGSCSKTGLTKAKSLGLDFREEWKEHSVHQKQHRKNSCSTDYTSAKAFEKLECEDKVENGGWATDLGKSFPPGNFYTSRGFWRRMEDTPRNKKNGELGESEESGEPAKTPQEEPAINPVPKPQRTFKYAGDHGPQGRGLRTDDYVLGSSHATARRGVDQKFPLPSYPPPSLPDGIARGRTNRKSFEFEDAEKLRVLESKSQLEALECGHSGLYHTLSEDNIYEDIVYPAKENPYEDVKLSTFCMLKANASPWKTSLGVQGLPPKLPPKPTNLSRQTPVVKRAHELRRGHHDVTTLPPARPPPPVLSGVDCMKNSPAADVNVKHRKGRRFVKKIDEIFEAKRGKKRVKIQAPSGPDTSSSREDASGTESDPEDRAKGTARRSVYVQSTLRRNPRYQTLERDLWELQEKQLFELFVVVSLRRQSTCNVYKPEITQQFPNKFEKSTRQSRDAEERLRAIPKFCFPDPQDWCPCTELISETFSFVLTGEDGSRWFGYCRKILPSGKGMRLPEVHCIISRMGCFSLFSKILEEVELRREVSTALVYPFMRSVMEAPFPAPGRTIVVKSFLPGSGNKVLELCRPVDSRLEHVDFQSLFQCLDVSRLLQVFASLLLERRVIFIADKLSTLSRCAHAAIALLYPFTWQHTYIPVLPASMIDITCSPTPFLIGVLSCALLELEKLPLEEVLIVHLDEGRFIQQISDEDCILPSKLQAALQQILEEREQILAQETALQEAGSSPNLSGLISEAFVRFFVELVGHYSLHMAPGDAGQRTLQRDAFRKAHTSRGARQFLQLFMETQMFAGFIHDRELRREGVKGLFELRAAEHLETRPEPESSGVNKFLKGLGNKMKFLQKK
ncbi:DENN domain-containing protein 2C isoform X1 [Polypterus senegalus]|uniref:DENN domain-containing protein 2C isoform X1 n=1 Tax=Polypterus senegalus TaxID=55291 RepID=UPI00196281FB|nr:DENN domain-containing protein 2C isoform X1 [Polypterus senegalus]